MGWNDDESEGRKGTSLLFWLEVASSFLCGSSWGSIIFANGSLGNTNYYYNLTKKILHPISYGKWKQKAEF